MSIFARVLVFFIYFVASAAGLIFMKTAPSYFNLKFVFGLCLYFSGALVWLYILRIFPLSIAFPIASGGLVVASTLLAVLILGENVNFWQVGGIISIIFGICLIGIKG